MPATTQNVELASTLRLCRHYQHSPHCSCFEYRGPQGEGYCTVDHFRYNTKLNNLLDLVRGA